MSQASTNIANSAGSVFRANLNAALEAILTQNSGATEPTTTYPNMWWYDTSTSLLKRRNNANDAWIIMGLEAASTDGTFAANSDTVVPTQKAARTFIEARMIPENRLSISDNTTADASTSAHGFLKKLSNVATQFMNGVGNWVAITIDSLLPSQTGNSGKFLTTNGSTSSWGSVSSSGLSNVLFQWCGSDNGMSDSTQYGMITSIGTVANYSEIDPSSKSYQNRFVKGTVYCPVYLTKFIKTSGVSTVTFYFRSFASSGTTPFVLLDIGGVQGVSNVSHSQSKTWKSLTVDVSGLTNGTVYDVSVQMKQESAGFLVYISSLIAFGS